MTLLVWSTWCTSHGRLACKANVCWRLFRVIFFDARRALYRDMATHGFCSYMARFIATACMMVKMPVLRKYSSSASQYLSKRCLTWGDPEVKEDGARAVR